MGAMGRDRWAGLSSPHTRVSRAGRGAGKRDHIYDISSKQPSIRARAASVGGRPWCSAAHGALGTLIGKWRCLPEAHSRRPMCIAQAPPARHADPGRALQVSNFKHRS